MWYFIFSVWVLKCYSNVELEKQMRSNFWELIISSGAPQGSLFLNIDDVVNYLNVKYSLYADD